MKPFIVFALPRSRTAWLSQFLSYRDWTCGHEELRHARSMDDVKTWLAMPNTGTAETAAAPWWRTVQKIAPDIRVVVVRRPVDDVVESLMRLGLPFNRDLLLAEMRRYNRKLDQIERRISNVLSVAFADLEREDVCAKVFEHCLPYQHDHEWWAALAPRNVQADMTALMRYMAAYRPQLTKLAAQVKCLTLVNFARKPLRDPDDLVIGEERFETFYRDGQRLFSEHLVEVGESPDAFRSKNLNLLRALDNVGAMQIITARCNGRMFGYLMSIIGPSMEHPDTQVAAHTTFFASPEFRGLGKRLQLASQAALRTRGVDELVLRAGTRGDGPRIGALYRRLGAEDHGQLFRIDLKD